MLSLYVTHPEVVIDPAVAMPRWGLSPKGRARAEAFATRDALPSGARFIASTERKAMETAQLIARGASVETADAFCENDRSATGYLEPLAFEAHVTALFSRPDESINGWETARAAQARIIKAVGAALANETRPVVFVGHGCVGTLFKCHVAGRPIARHEDQREIAWPGGGNVFAFDWAARRLIADWQSFEDFAPIAD